MVFSEKERREANERARIRRIALVETEFTAEEKARWAAVLHRTWHVIANDIGDDDLPDDERERREAIVEIVCDANYVELYGGMTHEEYEVLCVYYHRPEFKKWAYGVMNY